MPTNNQGINTTDVFTIISNFLGYRNREDITKLNPGTMVAGSQNVLMDVSGRLKSRKGFTLDGQVSATTTGILSAYDWEEHKQSVIHVRNPAGSLQYRYVSGTTVTWRDLITTLRTTQPLRYTNFWDDTEKQNVLLFVDGTSNVFEWNGAITTYASSTVNTITKEGTTTWAEDGFYVVGNKLIVIDGIVYTYTGGEGTTTLTGVTPDPTAGGHVAGAVVHQQTVTTSSAGISSLPATFAIDLISNLQNQIYYGNVLSNIVYVSVVNNYKSVAFTSPVRVVGEGAKVTLRDNVKAFKPQESSMYVSAGKSQWYNTKKTLSSDNAKEFFDIVPLKSASQQGAQTQEMVTNDKNNVIYISNEPVLTSLGPVVNVYQTPQLTDYSAPIVNDFNNYDFTDATVKYYKNYIYICIPAEGVMRVYNQTNPMAPFWEAPQTFNFSCLSVIDGELYAHDYSIKQSYKLFDDYSDLGLPISSKAVFSYVNYGSKAQSRFFNEFFVDGYMNANTDITVKYKLDIDGCAQTITKMIAGDDTQITCPIADDASLGKASLGKHGLGTESIVTETDPLPPYFNVVLTNQRKDFYHAQYSFESLGTDYRWELLSFGPLVTKSPYGNNAIKQ